MVDRPVDKQEVHRATDKGFKRSEIVGGNNDGPKSEMVLRKTWYPKTIQTFSNAALPNRLHPTQKPVPLLEYLIKTYTKEKETVLDFTAGSFSTGVAAMNLSRSFIGIESDKDYFNAGKKRIKRRE